MADLTLIATSTMGLESLVARELKGLGYAPKNSASRVGRTIFSGGLVDLVRANIHLRTAGKILIQLAEFDVKNDFDQIFEAVDSIPWEDWMAKDAAVTVEARSVRSTITSVPALQRVVKKGIVKRLTSVYHLTELPENGVHYGVEISLYKDRASITLDSTGRGLHRRGYRRMNVAAPLRETLAAALIQLSVWRPDRPLIDPFCGSGTIPIEAALIGRNIPPGLTREFDAQFWPTIGGRIWSEGREEARAGVLPPLSEKIRGYDIDPESVRLARYHAERAGVGGDILFETGDFANLTDPRSYGCVIMNPPYGDRIGEIDRLRPLYESIPAVLSRLSTWSHFIFTAWNDFEKVIGQNATRRRKLYNGRIECTYFQFLGPKPPKPEISGGEKEDSAENRGDVEEKTGTDGVEGVEFGGSDDPESGPNEVPRSMTPVFAGLDDYADYQAREFSRCLANRVRHLRNYPKRGITCYRLYERDFPEVPLVIDIYEGKFLHIAEFDRPDGRSPGVHRLWLDKMIATARETLHVEPENVFVKRRLRQKGLAQYEKLGESGRFITVNEGGLSFRCNMTDYLDTGLFLDHRKTREMVRKESRGKRFLNLFCYTGSFSCYAADGGATSTVSVDLSTRYLEWAEANLAMNGFTDTALLDRWEDGGRSSHSPRSIPRARHLLIRSDVIPFLAGGSRFGEGEKFDLCVCDPPTFSNSKSTEEDWDVRRRHVELLRLLATRMVSGGVVYFSNNFRRFKLDEEQLGEIYQIREITHRTIPEEFRNKHIHRCWRMIVK